MFTKIEATVPLNLPNLKPPVPCELTIDREYGDIKLEFHYIPTSENLIEVIRYNQLKGLKLDWVYGSEAGGDRVALGMVLTEDEQQMADKLTDAGLSQKEAETWVAGVVAKAFERGQSGSGL
jgi:hypothetical protein